MIFEAKIYTLCLQMVYDPHKYIATSQQGAVGKRQAGSFEKNFGDLTQETRYIVKEQNGAIHTFS